MLNFHSVKGPLEKETHKGAILRDYYTNIHGNPVPIFASRFFLWDNFITAL